jgi:hypothetical protein
VPASTQILDLIKAVLLLNLIKHNPLGAAGLSEGGAELIIHSV